MVVRTRRGIDGASRHSSGGQRARDPRRHHGLDRLRLGQGQQRRGRLGIFLTHNRELLGLDQPEETYSITGPDITLHEVSKFIRLAIKANPTVLELPWLDAYTTPHPAGALLIANRDLFLSRRVLQSYGGYVMSQVQRLRNRGDSFGSDTRNRTEKHAQHIFRLFQQGRRLLQTGRIEIAVRNRDELFDLASLPVDEVIARFDEYARFLATPHGLPPEPDKVRINELLLKIRETWGA